MIPRRGSPAVAMKALSSFGESVKKDVDVLPLIFPEGTRSKDGQLGKFYSAGFRMLSQTVRLPVVVCALDGGWKLSNLTRIVSSLRTGSYKVKVLKVYEAPKDKEDEKLILEESYGLIEKQLSEWRSGVL